MKITLEPSNNDLDHFAKFVTVTVDTRSNDESPEEAVRAFNAAAIAYGHLPSALCDGMKQIIQENP